MIQGSKIDVILRSSGKTSFVTFFRDLLGKEWNPREDRSLKGSKVFTPKQSFLEHSNDVLSSRNLHLVSVLYNISPLPSCSSSGVWFL